MKFLISGYYGFDNLGDEAILAVLIEELHREFPDAELVVLSHKPAETERQYKVRAINRWSIQQILKELWNATLFISGGGGLIQDRTSRRSALYYLGLLRIAQRFCPVVMIGQGIGPLKSPVLQMLARKIFRQVDLALLRDETSREVLRRANLPAERVIVGRDLTLLAWPRWAPLREPASETPSTARSYIGVCLSGKLSARLKTELAAQLDRVHAELGLEPILVSYHLHEDLKPLEEIKKKMKAPALVVEPSAHDHSGLMACIAQTRFILGMRLHSLIFALLSARPALAILGDPKLDRFSRQVRQAGGFEFPCWSPAQIESGQMNLLRRLQEIELCYEPHCSQLRQAGEVLFNDASFAAAGTWQALRALLESQPKQP